ncbi:hypothetical protein Q3G72_029034 [Acer saccharum]|nr:hypothetical protein Q3G72_029034 [Acer saccharum]
MNQLQAALWAEIKAILKACELVGSNSSLVGRPLIIRSDSKIAVRWARGESSEYGTHEIMMKEIHRWLEGFLIKWWWNIVPDLPIRLRIQAALWAEIKAILKACELVGSNSSLVGRPLIIRSDSKIAVRWARGESSEYGTHEIMMKEIHRWLEGFDQVVVEYCPRSSNSFADILAKKGLLPGTEEVYWSDL